MSDPTPTAPKTPKRRRSPLGKTLLIAAALLLVYTLAGFFLAPPLIKRQLEGYVKTDLGRRLTIERVRLNPFSLDLVFEGASLTEADGKPLLAFDRFGANVQLRSLADWAWVFSEVRLERPRVHLRIAPDGVFNVTRLVADAIGGDTAAQEPAASEPSSRVRLDFRHLAIRDGTLVISDESQDTPAKAAVAPINLEVSNLTTLPGNDGRQAVTATLPKGGVLKWKGSIRLMPFSSDGELSLRNFNEGVGWQFVRRKVGIRQPQGAMDLDLFYHIGYGDDGFRMALERMSIRIDGLVLALKDQPDDPLLKMEEIRLSGGRFDLGKHELVVEKVRLSRGRVQAVMDSLGEVNWARIVASEPAPAPDGQDAAAFPFTACIQQVVVEDVSADIRDHSWHDPLQVAVKSVDATLSANLCLPAQGDFQTRLDGIEMTISDAVVGAVGADPILRLPQARVDGGTLDAVDYRLWLDKLVLSRGTTRVALEKDGRMNWQRLFTPLNAAAARAVSERIEEIVSQDWSVQVADLRFEDFRIALEDHYLAEGACAIEKVRIDIRDFDTDPEKHFQAHIAFEMQPGGGGDVTATVAPFKPDLQAAVDIRSIALTPLQPYLSSVLRLKLASGALSVKGRLTYAPEGGLKWRGMLQMDDLGLTMPGSGEKLASLKQMVIAEMAFDAAPTRLNIKSIRMVAPFLKLNIRRDGSVNLADVVVGGAAGAKDMAADIAAAKPPEFSIGHVRVEKGTMDFADHSLPLPFEALIQDLVGGVSGFSTDPDSRAAVEMRGRIPPYGSVRIKGLLLPSKPTDFAQIVMTFRNVDMPRLTPYSTKFAGREITSGKMNLELVYGIEKNRLIGENRIVLDHFELGKRVESPEAVNLPLDLAVALLKDNRGRIDIGLEVSGNVDDPQFSYGHLIWQALLNLIQKIVTAPFQALAHLMGAKAEGVDSVVFEPGRADIPPPEAEKLARVAAVLEKRPKLVLTVNGCYNAEADATALKEIRLRRELASRMGLSDAMQQMRGPLALNDPTLRKALDTLAAERLKPEALAAARADGETSSGRAGKSGTQAGLSPGMLKYYQQVYRLLIAGEPLEKAALDKLGAARAAAVAAAVQARGLPAGRVVVAGKGPGGKAEKGRVRCTLGLDVSK